ncbi:hypothetical protein C0J52_01301 [Blattella germanica]|nr:hypothetical protein C0J52_01301 [Blattella germanica]
MDSFWFPQHLQELELSGVYRLRAKNVKIHQLRAVVSWDIHSAYINYAQRLLSTFSRLILIARSGHLVSTLMQHVSQFVPGTY